MKQKIRIYLSAFKDDATAFNNLKKASVETRVLNNRISEYILTNLSQCGIKTFYQRIEYERTTYKKAEIFRLNLL